MVAKSQHVAPKVDGTWAVRTTGAVRASRVFRNESQAVAYAKSKSVGPIYIHGKNGLIVRKETPPDTKSQGQRK